MKLNRGWIEELEFVVVLLLKTGKSFTLDKSTGVLKISVEKKAGNNYAVSQVKRIYSKNPRCTFAT